MNTIYWIGFYVHGIVLVANAYLHREKIFKEVSEYESALIASAVVLYCVLAIMFWYLNIVLMIGVTLASFLEKKGRKE